MNSGSPTTAIRKAVGLGDHPRLLLEKDYSQRHLSKIVNGQLRNSSKCIEVARHWDLFPSDRLTLAARRQAFFQVRIACGALTQETSKFLAAMDKNCELKVALRVDWPVMAKVPLQLKACEVCLHCLVPLS